MNVKQQETKSSRLYAQARKILPGGISRNTIYRTPNPDYADFGKGCRVTDLQGVSRIDFANNMCSLIHGHAYDPVIEAVTNQLQRGSAFTLATEAELAFAQHMCQRNSGFEMIRFMNSGTEAVMAAIKASRAITGKPMIAKSEGAYHGTYDYAEVSQKAKPENWGDQQQPNKVPVVEGTPQKALDDVLIIPFNDVPRSLSLLETKKDQIACVIIDPLPHRVGLIPATKEFISALRQWTTDNDCLMVFDEVITFRMGYGGAQEWFDQQPDLTSMGKIIGGGFPVGALAGSSEFMNVMDPTREHLPFPFSGTFSANPITMTAGRVAMEQFDQAAVERLNSLGEYARKKITETIAAAGATACVTGAGSMFRVHLKAEPPTEYRSAYQSKEETKLLKFLLDHLYENGFMMINTLSGCLSTAMSESEIDQLSDALHAAFAAAK